MVVEKTQNRIKCDASGCKNLSEYVIINKKFVFDGSVFLCANCLSLLYGEIGKFFTPKNVKPIFKVGGKDGKIK